MSDAPLLPPNPEGIPAELKAHPHWVVWRAETVEGRRTKVPYAPATGRRASVRAPEDWASFEAAWRAYQAGGYDGVGFVLTPDLQIVGIDLDGVVHQDRVRPWAKRLVRALHSYTERSPSGRGLRIFLRGRLPESGKRWGPIEVYAAYRYLTVTGARLEGSPRDLRAPAKRLEQVWRELLERQGRRRAAPSQPKRAVPPPVQDEAEVLERAFRSRVGAEVRTLYEGRWRELGRYASQSEADLALASYLVFFAGGDLALADRLFRRSGLYRPKWDEPHYADGTTYGQATLRKALEG